MATQSPKANERSTAYMLEEFRFLKASYEGAMTWRDERFKNFINIIFGSAALLAIVAQLSKTHTELNYSILIISFVLFLYGLFVFSRIVAGSFSIERYKRAINRVRKYFVDLDTGIEEYLLVSVNSPKSSNQKSRMGSGLIGTTAFTNSLLILVFGTTAMLQVASWQIWSSAGIGLIMAITSWFFHSSYYSGQVKKHTEKAERKTD